MAEVTATAALQTPVDVLRGSRGLVLVALPVSWLGFEVDETARNPATADNLETGHQVMARLPRTVALLDGPMFDLVGGGSDYAHAAAARLLYRYLDRRRGIDSPTSYPDRGATLSVGADGRAVWMTGAREVAGATFAMQGYPEVIRDRVAQVTAAHNTDVVGRSAVCLLADGRAGLAVATATMANFAASLLELPGGVVRSAVYTDGGGSTTLALRGQGGDLVVTRGLDSRRLPVYVIAEPPPGGVGMVGNPSGAPGWVSPTVKVLGGAVAGTGALYALREIVRWWRQRPPAGDDGA